jgi:hypothetical protein
MDAHLACGDLLGVAILIRLTVLEFLVSLELVEIGRDATEIASACESLGFLAVLTCVEMAATVADAILHALHAFDLPDDN